MNRYYERWSLSNLMCQADAQTAAIIKKKWWPLAVERVSGSEMSKRSHCTGGGKQCSLGITKL